MFFIEEYFKTKIMPLQLKMYVAKSSGWKIKKLLETFGTLGLKILILLRLKEVFEIDIFKGWC